MDLSELHDCEKCHGKLVMITVDKVGVTRCGYCNKVVDYHSWFKTTDAYKEYKKIMAE